MGHHELSQSMNECCLELQKDQKALEKVETTITPYRGLSLDILATESIKNELVAQLTILNSIEQGAWTTTCLYTQWIFELEWSTLKKQKQMITTQLEILI